MTPRRPAGASSAPLRARDSGASAVEFALVMPLLLMILLGVIQYGFGLYQLQSFTSVVNDASKMAGTGINACGTFRSQVRAMAGDNGIDPASITAINVSWLSQNPVSHTYAATATAERMGMARVTATFTPFHIGVPFVPFPAQITRTQTAPVQDLGLLSGAC